MSRFYLYIWLYWLGRVVVCTLLSASFLAFAVTLFIYIKQGFAPLESEVRAALLEIWIFWFSITLNIALLFALFRSVKYLFNRCYGGFMLKLKSCTPKSTREFIDPVGYGDLVKVWRKWFMSLIWLTGGMMVIAFGLTYLLSAYDSLFSWFDITVLYLFIALSGYISLMLLVARCKSIKVIKC